MAQNILITILVLPIFLKLLFEDHAILQDWHDLANCGQLLQKLHFKVSIWSNNLIAKLKFLNTHWQHCKFTYNLLVMGHDRNLREFSVNVISHFIICVNHEICEWQFSLYFMILNEKLANFWVNSHESAKITEIGQDKDFTI